jgi:hypothetical protein
LIIGATQLVESQPVKRRLGGWCETAACLAVVRVVGCELCSAREAVKKEPERVKAKNVFKECILLCISTIYEFYFPVKHNNIPIKSHFTVHN